jgi:hypothetical protein
MCGVLVGAMGLRFPPPLESGLPAHLQNIRGFTSAGQIAKTLESKQRVPVIWLEFQDCAGCSEALTRSQSPTLVNFTHGVRDPHGQCERQRPGPSHEWFERLRELTIAAFSLGSYIVGGESGSRPQSL